MILFAIVTVELHAGTIQQDSTAGKTATATDTTSAVEMRPVFSRPLDVKVDYESLFSPEDEAQPATGTLEVIEIDRPPKQIIENRRSRVAIIFGSRVASFLERGRASAGVKFGWGIAELSGWDVAAQTDPATSFAGGFFLTYWLRNTFAIQPEIFFILKGGAETYNFILNDPVRDIPMFNVNTSTTWRLSYLEMPILFKTGSAIPDYRFNLFFEFGPSVGLKLSQRASDDYRVISLNFRYDPDDYSHEENHQRVRFGTLEFSFVLGMGGDFKMGRGSVTGQIRFHAGLASAGDNPDKAYTTILTYLLGYTFPLF